MRQLTRRQALHAGLAGAGFALTGCWKTTDKLRVFCYAGGHEAAMREVFVPRFQAMTGVEVELHAGWWDGIPKLKAAPPDDPPFDLMISDATQGFAAVKDGLFTQLDLNKIPNHQALVPAALDHWVFKERYGITYPDSVMTIAYHKHRVPNPPVGWADLLRPDVAGKIGMYENYYMSLFTFACIRAGVEGRPGTAHQIIRTDLDGVIRFARDHRDLVKLWWPTSTDMILALVNGDCAVGNMHSPEYLQALREKPDLGAVVPDTDRAFVQVFWAIPAGTRKKELAERAIDALFSEPMQLGFAQKGSATAIPAVAQRMASDDSYWKQIYPHTPEQFAGLRYYPYDFYAEHADHITEVWDRTVRRNG